MDCEGKVVEPAATSWKGMWIGLAVSRGVHGAVNDDCMTEWLPEALRSIVQLMTANTH